MAAMRESELTRKILRYFVRNSEAADTFEGIVRWRLMEEAIHQTTEETEQALAWLVAQGFLQESSVGERGPLFRLNAQKRTEAERFLATASATREET
jgi:hypothetical protein